MPGSRVSEPGSESRQGPAGLGMAGHRVVVGQRHHVQAGLRGAAHHLGGRVGSVRGTAVHMQVGPHQGAGRRGETAPKGRSRSWPGSRRSRSPIGSTSRAPAVSGHSTSHSQQAFDLAGEHRAVLRIHRPERKMIIAERGGGDRRRRAEPRPGIHAVQAGQSRAEADAWFLGHDHHVRRAAERVRAGQRHRAGADAGAFVARAGETRDQPADRKRPGQPDRDARGPQQPVQARPWRD